nr:hypothetical protein [Anaerolineae bacterium]
MSGKLASGAQRYAIDALALLSPDERNPLLGGLSFAQGLAAGERGGVYLGISVLALAAAGLFSSG